MPWVAHLLVPLLIALFVAFTTGGSSSSNFWSSYFMFSWPHWVWAAIAAYFGVSRLGALGGFTGANVLLVAASGFVLRSSAPEAANGWLLYFIGAPAVITLGALIGGWVGSRVSPKA